MKEALELIFKRTLGVIKLLADFADREKATVILGSTHGQAAQPTTVGRRAAGWLQDFMVASNCINRVRNDELKFRGFRGATGTQESFLKLFDGDEDAVKLMDKLATGHAGWTGESYPITSQTYPRALDTMIMDALKMVALAASRFALDMRLLQRDKEMEEPFGKNQVGSSAMAYKRNPMRSERAVSLARYITGVSPMSADTTKEQWFERTLDDSAISRITIPEAFMLLDEVLIISANVADGIVVNKAIIDKRLWAELPFMATEEILMEAVKEGGDRQELHERIRIHSMAAAEQVKKFGNENDLIFRIVGDPAFGLTLERAKKTLNPSNLCGRAVTQTEEFLDFEVYPLLANYESMIVINSDLKV
jgi:adenylosuccinate lyase